MKRFNNFKKRSNLIKIQNFPSLLINEGLIKSVSTNTILNMLTKLFNDDVEITIDENNIRIADNNQQIKKKANKFFNLLNVAGWYINYYYLNYTNYNEILNIYNFHELEYDKILINLVKKFDIEKKDGIPEILYHVTFEENLEKIEKQGLVPKSKSKIEYHKKRIYIMDDYDEAQNFADTLEYNYNRDVAVLIINTKLLNKIKLYYDPTYYVGSDITVFNAFYTYDNIPPQAIINI
jgi:hypothetical protein